MSTRGRRDPSPSGGAVDPTGTTTIRRRYAARLRGRWAAINTEIRDGVGDRDVFGLDTRGTGLAAGEPDGRAVMLETYDENPDFEDPSSIRQILNQRNEAAADAFTDWLDEQVDKGVLEVIHRGDNPYVRASFDSGVQSTLTSFEEGAVTTPGGGSAGVVQADESGVSMQVNPEALGDSGVGQARLQELYARNYSNLESVGEDVTEAVREEITRGFGEGIGPDDMARNITDRVDSIGKHQSTVLARTETINAHSEGAVTRLEEAEADLQAEIVGEWLATDDRRTCPICETLDGNTYEPTNIRTETFDYEAGEGEPASLSGTYPVMPPAHPQCRCSIAPAFP